MKIRNITSKVRHAAIAAVLASVPTCALAAGEMVAVIAADGTVHEVALVNVDRINLTDSGVELIVNEGADVSLPYADVERIDIGVAAGIADITAQGNVAVYPTVTSGHITVAGAVPGARVDVYDMSGRCLVRTVAAGDPVNLDLSAAPAGYLIVNVGAHSVKIIKK